MNSIPYSCYVEYSQETYICQGLSFRVCVVFQDAIRRAPYEKMEEVGGVLGQLFVAGHAPVHVALELLVARMRSSPAPLGAPKRKMSS